MYVCVCVCRGGGCLFFGYDGVLSCVFVGKSSRSFCVALFVVPVGKRTQHNKTDKKAASFVYGRKMNKKKTILWCSFPRTNHNLALYRTSGVRFVVL